MSQACTPASGWEKGQVENQVGLVCERFFTRRLRFKSYSGDHVSQSKNPGGKPGVLAFTQLGLDRSVPADLVVHARAEDAVIEPNVARCVVAALDGRKTSLYYKMRCAGTAYPVWPAQ
jgi:hypothetical protein